MEVSVQVRGRVQLVEHKCSRFQIFKNRGKEENLQGFCIAEVVPGLG